MVLENRILITGANGFVGTWLQRELASRKSLGGLSVFPVGHGSAAGQRVDITDYHQVAEAIREAKPTAIVHLAAVAAPNDARRAYRRAWDINVTGTMNVAQAAMEIAPHARLIFAGSADAYGESFIEADGEPVTEKAALKPLSVYGATKAAADILLGQLAGEGLKSIRFRPFNHTGPGQSDAYVVPAFARQVAEISAGLKPPLIEVGNLAAQRDFMDVRDVVRAYADAALADIPDAFGRVFNLASGKPRQIHAILDALVEKSGLKIEIRVDPERLRGSEVAIASGDAGAALEVFNWKPEISFETTLIDVLDDWKQRVAAEQDPGARQRTGSAS
ncbi:NAD-dependent epimerase/dehydratase family protein [Phyllobacterium salinisoli]|uniref:NAD-dependent epimerase/dehydratase family protein n=1 Tax=Phyllobacterium salinisoli TaxID=1899321 RepID=A0A368K2A4_9HYPH|nr:GDP-mannose 4,6-dehydratase [Phyllobacterium salinisoli]RCS23331.1 NAD-dependent epimerase/dehydratase family protein [Phyllobacterium salinisoli]